jgi:hypothetical protein
VRAFKKVLEMSLSLGESKAYLSSCQGVRVFKKVPEMALSLARVEFTLALVKG